MHMIIAEQRKMGEFAIWCAYESEKKNADATPCYMLAADGAKAEKAVLDGIPLLKEVIQQLKLAPKNKTNEAHIAVLQSELRELESLPTPFYDILLKDHK